jgi:rhamnosyl/mannosyltransferase
MVNDILPKVRVLQVNKLYPPVVGGVEKVVQQIAEGLRSRADMKVLVCRAKGRTLKEQVNGVEVCRAGSFGTAASMPISISFFFWFQKLKKDRDVLHIHMPFPLADLALFLLGFSGKVVLWWHSDIVRQRKLLAVYRPLMKRTLERADVIMTATQGHIDGSEFLPAYREKCVVIPFGVEPRLLKDSEGVYPGCAPEEDKSNIKRQHVTFLFAGRLVYYKGCDILLEALAKVHGSRLVVVGAGPLEQYLKNKAKELGVSGYVEFKGYLEDREIARCFADCDVFVLPSVAKSEAFGIVQIEAMAYGKPVINTRLPGGVPYVSLDGITGLTVPPGDVEALTAAMQKLADDPALRLRLGQAAYRRVREEFCMDRMMERVYEGYRRAGEDVKVISREQISENRV